MLVLVSGEVPEANGLYLFQKHCGITSTLFITAISVLTFQYDNNITDKKSKTNDNTEVFLLNGNNLLVTGSLFFLSDA